MRGLGISSLSEAIKNRGIEDEGLKLDIALFFVEMLGDPNSSVAEDAAEALYAIHSNLSEESRNVVGEALRKAYKEGRINASPWARSIFVDLLKKYSP